MTEFWDTAHGLQALAEDSYMRANILPHDEFPTEAVYATTPGYRIRARKRKVPTSFKIVGSLALLLFVSAFVWAFV